MVLGILHPYIDSINNKISTPFLPFHFNFSDSSIHHLGQQSSYDNGSYNVTCILNLIQVSTKIYLRKPIQVLIPKYFRSFCHNSNLKHRSLFLPGSFSI